MSEQRLKIYLAGKITKDNDWRGDILGSHRPGGQDSEPFEGAALSDWKWQPQTGAIFGAHDYAGPFFVSCDHGCAHGPTSHGMGAGEGDLCGIDPPTREEVVARCMVAIQESDLLFAYLTSADAYGTLIEMGYARGRGVDVAVAWSPSLNVSEMWFARDIATYVAGPFSNPSHGLKRSSGCCEESDWGEAGLGRRCRHRRERRIIGLEARQSQNSALAVLVLPHRAFDRDDPGLVSEVPLQTIEIFRTYGGIDGAADFLLSLALEHRGFESTITFGQNSQDNATPAKDLDRAFGCEPLRSRAYFLTRNLNPPKRVVELQRCISLCDGGKQFANLRANLVGCFDEERVEVLVAATQTVENLAEFSNPARNSDCVPLQLSGLLLLDLETERSAHRSGDDGTTQRSRFFLCLQFCLPLLPDHARHRLDAGQHLRTKPNVDATRRPDTIVVHQYLGDDVGRTRFEFLNALAQFAQAGLEPDSH